jgi:gamma-glutamyl:cysteine ligase YbdK (ATP-grasp superfamily)
VPPAAARFAGTAAALAALLGVLVAAHEAQRQRRALESRKAEVLASRKAEPEVRAPRAGSSAKHGGGRVGGGGA